MKRFAIYILIGFYVLSQLKPVAVVVEDVLAHTFWRAQHMATVHYENGRYHIHTELSDISKEEQSAGQEKTPSTQKTNENIQQNISEVNFKFQLNGILIPVTITQKQDIIPGFTGINLPPPKKA